MSAKPSQPIVLTAQEARRLAITCQRLAGEHPTPDMAGLLQVMRAIRCLQLDPIGVVARSPFLVLWSRLGHYDQDLLSQALWRDRALFEYWAHAASIVLVDDWPIHRWYMAHQANGGWRPQSRQWLDENRDLREHILTRLRSDGPLAANDMVDAVVVEESHANVWNNGRTVNTMLDFLWFEGRVLVAGRRNQTRLWDLAHRCLPQVDTALQPDRDEVVDAAAALAVRALGVATAKQIKWHFTRHRYPGLPRAVKRLLQEGTLLPAKVVGGEGEWPGDWFIHTQNMSLLQQLREGVWLPRTTLLSPFDNLICDRERTEQLFDFFFRIEIYVPKAKRQYGYYVLPILHGDRLVGRIDPRYDRAAKRLLVQNVYAEPHAENDEATGAAAADAIDELAHFLGAEEVVYERAAPAAWGAAMPASN